MSCDRSNALLARADAALYLAKGAGRNCVYLHEGPAGRIVKVGTEPESPTNTAPDSAVAPILDAAPPAPRLEECSAEAY